MNKSTSSFIKIICILITISILQSTFAQENNYGTIKPEVKIQKDDYANERKEFKTNLIKQSGSPQEISASDSADIPPPGVSECSFKSGNLTLKAWINKPEHNTNKKYPVVVFLHGGFAFGKGDWDMTKPFRDSGFIIITPMLRGEDNQEGFFSMFYNEVDDAIAATEYIRQQPFIDEEKIYLAGHSVGGILALLTSMSCKYFKKAVSFSGLPDMLSNYKYVINPKEIPFDTTNTKELQMRSPMANATSFKCPVRLYFGTEEPWILGSTSQQTAVIAKKNGLDAEAKEVQGGHMSAVEEEMRLAITFFNQ